MIRNPVEEVRRHKRLLADSALLEQYAIQIFCKCICQTPRGETAIQFTFPDQQEIIGAAFRLVNEVRATQLLMAKESEPETNA